MKKILHIVEAMGGGVFTYIVDLSNQLCDEYEVYIAYAVRPQTPENYREYFDERIKLIEVKNFNRSVDLTKDAKAFFEIKKIAKEVDPDLIHLHSSKAGALGRWAFDGKKHPICYTPHGYSFLMKNCSWVKRTIYKTVEMVSSKRCCTTISCSFGEHEETLKMTKKATYINNGINTEELQKLIDTHNSRVEIIRPFTCFTLGRISYQKNPELFNEIAEKLPDIKFLWIGDGELRDKLASPNIEITGWTERENALKYTTQGDAFILTSLWEGLPISLLEAMYMKKICVVSNVIGNKDVINNGINGYVCNNADEFVKALNEIKSKPDSSITESAYQNVLNEYNVNVMGDKYKMIYEKII